MYIIYSKDQCSQCVMAKNFLNAKKLPFEVKMLDVEYTREYLEDLFKSLMLSMPRSFPIVFHEGSFVGGLNELKVHVMAQA